MDIKEVKRDLPPVLGRLEGRLYWCRVSGRLNQFATVSPEHLLTNKLNHVRSFIGPCFEVAWATVAKCITENKAIGLS